MSTFDPKNLKSLEDVPSWLNNNMPIGQQVRQTRQALGMTQQQLAERSGFKQSVIAEIEAGKRKDPCLSTIQKLAAALNCRSLVKIVPEEDIDTILDKRSTEIALMIANTASASAAIEMQMPNPKMIQDEVKAIKKDLLGKDKSALWQEI